MPKNEQDVYVDEEGRKTQLDWDNNQSEYIMEGFFDYKEKLVNPAAGNLKFNKKKMKKFMETFKLINRDLQLGNLTQEDYTLIFRHFNLGLELMRFGLVDAALLIIQKGYTLLVMSNSKGGFQRKLEYTNISIRRLQTEASKKPSFWDRRKEKRR